MTHIERYPRIGARRDIETAAEAAERGMVWNHLHQARALAARSIP